MAHALFGSQASLVDSSQTQAVGLTARSNGDYLAWSNILRQRLGWRTVSDDSASAAQGASVSYEQFEMGVSQAREQPAPPVGAWGIMCRPCHHAWRCASAFLPMFMDARYVLLVRGVSASLLCT